MFVEVLRPLRGDRILEQGTVVDVSSWSPVRVRQLIEQRYLKAVLAPPTAPASKRGAAKETPHA